MILFCDLQAALVPALVLALMHAKALALALAEQVLRGLAASSWLLDT